MFTKEFENYKVVMTITSINKDGEQDVNSYDMECDAEPDINEYLEDTITCNLDMDMELQEFKVEVFHITGTATYDYDACADVEEEEELINSVKKVLK